MDYYPEIKEKVSDPKHHRSKEEIPIIKAAEAVGSFVPKQPARYGEIRAQCLAKGHDHDFSFTDSDTKTSFAGEVDVNRMLFREAEIRLQTREFAERSIHDL